MKNFVVAAALLLASILAPATRPAADDWPNRYVRVVVVGGAGGSGDVLARLVAGHLSSAFK
jgi:tripartite-type tricarboxylate transporter receptor subunit TctC